MPEPVSSGAAAGAGGAVAWKAVGGAAGVAGGAVALATWVVMVMTMPNNRREWSVALISTIISSLSFGSYIAVHWLKMGDAIMPAIADGDTVSIMLQFSMLGGAMFAAGLPGWFLVRSAFRWMEKNKDKDLKELVDEVRNGAIAGR